MKRKIVKKIVFIAEKAAYRGVAKSWTLGAYEIKPPKELLDKKRSVKR